MIATEDAVHCRNDILHELRLVIIGLRLDELNHISGFSSILFENVCHVFSPFVNADEVPDSIDCRPPTFLRRLSRDVTSIDLDRMNTQCQEMLDIVVLIDRSGPFRIVWRGIVIQRSDIHQELSDALSIRMSHEIFETRPSNLLVLTRLCVANHIRKGALASHIAVFAPGGIALTILLRDDLSGNVIENVRDSGPVELANEFPSTKFGRQLRHLQLSVADHVISKSPVLIYKSPNFFGSNFAKPKLLGLLVQLLNRLLECVEIVGWNGNKNIFHDNPWAVGITYRDQP
ncbi:hypothetical protein RsoM2USA_105 [Ralstonia phage RsoM2USA]|nr:hypothetical protein RsoM2USA_105 [Ralstonia phage RsoM2USA]